MLYLQCAMFTNKVVLWSVVTLALIVTQSSCISSPKTQEGMEVALDTTVSFYNMFIQCIDSAMPSMKFALDDPKNFVNYPSRTTVGFAPRFTSNRKFFANMLSSPEFKNMVETDEKELKRNLVNKMKYCDSVVMDEGMLQAMYNREVDQTKL